MRLARASPGLSNRIIRVRSGDVGRELPQDVLGTNNSQLYFYLKDIAIMRTELTCNKILLQKPINFGIPLK